MGDKALGLIDYLISIVYNDDTEVYTLSLKILWLLGKNKEIREYLTSPELGLVDKLHEISKDDGTPFRKETLHTLWNSKTAIKHAI